MGNIKNLELLSETLDQGKLQNLDAAALTHLKQSNIGFTL